MLHCKGRLLPVLIHNTYLESFISICCRISCLSSSVLLGKIFLSSSSCLLGLFRSFTASSSFLHFLGKVPGTCIERKVIRKAAPGDETGTSGGQEWHRVTVICVLLCKEQLYPLMSESSTTAEQGPDTNPNAEGIYSSGHAASVVKSLFHPGSTVCNRRLISLGSFLL